MHTYRVLVFPKNGFSFYLVVHEVNSMAARISAQTQYPDATIATVQEIG